MPIHLRPITIENWKEAIALQLRPEQRGFVPENVYSIAEAQFYADAKPLAVYNETNQMVGFLLYGRDLFTGKWKVFRMMIDAAQQGKGYGRAAMQAVIAEIQHHPDGNEVLICYQAENQAARTLYASLGFVEQSINLGVVTAKLSRERHKDESSL